MVILVLQDLQSDAKVCYYSRLQILVISKLVPQDQLFVIIGAVAVMYINYK